MIVIIIGAQRSGTTKLASYFREVLDISGHAEGHIFRLMHHLESGVEQIQKTIPTNAYSINKVGTEQLFRSAYFAFKSNYFEYLKWPMIVYDKTPGIDMIKACKLIARFDSDAKFIHITRSGIGNVESLLRKDKNRTFENACLTWSAVISAFEEIKPLIEHRTLQLTMEELATDPVNVHRSIINYLGVDLEIDSAEINDFFSTTSNSSKLDHVPRSEPNIDDTGWTDEQKRVFTETCGREMTLTGYW